MKLIILTFIVILSGCAANGPIYKPHVKSELDTSIIYIYRPDRVVNCCVSPAVYINGKRLDSLKNAGYLVYEFPAGSFEITVGDGSYGFEEQTIKIELQKNSSQYLKWVIGSINNFDMAAGYAPRNYHLIPIPIERANQEISNLKLSKS